MFAIFAGTIESKKKAQQQNFLLALKPDSDHFHDSLSYIADDLRTKITIDNKNDRLFIWLPEDPNVKTINDVKLGMTYKVHTYSHTDILAIQQIEDDVCLTKRARKSSSAKFWLTETPAFTDVSTTQPASKSEVNTISLVILVRDKAYPIHRIHFYTNPSKNLQKNTDEYKQIQTDLQQWLTAFDFMMKEADQKEGVTTYAAENLPFDKLPKMPHVKSNSEQIQKKNAKDQIISMKLLPVLQQVMHKKTQTEASLKHDAQFEATKSSSYFDRLLQQNREIMAGKQEDE